METQVFEDVSPIFSGNQGCHYVAGQSFASKAQRWPVPAFDSAQA
jgi:hypothetical protein